MAKIEYKTTSSHVTVDEDDLNVVRKGMYDMYKNHGGRHELTESSPLVYDTLEEIFKSRFQELDAEVYLQPGKERRPCYSPGGTFLRDLFYSKLKAKSMKSKQSNFDLCFFFAFGFSLQQYTKEKRAANGKKPAGLQKAVILSTLSTYTTEMENFQKYVEVKIGKPVATDLRDVQGSNIGSLFSFHSDAANSTIPAVYLIGRGHFRNENCLLDLIKLSQELKDSFKRNARIVFLEDIWEGDYDLKNATGVLRLTDYWHGHISFMEEQANKRKGQKIPADYKEVAKNAKAGMKESKAKTKALINEIPPLVNFLLTEVKNLPYNYLMNKVNKEEVEKWLNAEHG